MRRQSRRSSLASTSFALHSSRNGRCGRPVRGAGGVRWFAAPGLPRHGAHGAGCDTLLRWAQTR